MKGLLRRILALAVATVMLVSMATNAYAATFTLPSDLKTIEAQAFEGDTAIDTVVLPDGITTIGSRAFADSSLKSINLPRSLTSIATDAFEDSPNVVANVKSGSYAMTYCVDNNIPYVTDPVNMPSAMIPISVSASASTVEMGDTVTLTFSADSDLPDDTSRWYYWNVIYFNAAGEVISADSRGRSKLGDFEMLVQCAGAAKLRISVSEATWTTPGAHPTVDIAVTGGDTKPYLEYSVMGEVYPGGKLRATVAAMNADKLTAAETVTITDEMGSFTQNVTVSAASPKVSVDITVPRTWSWYDENGDTDGYGVIFKHGNDEYTHYAYGEPLCDPFVESWVGDFFTIYTRVLPSEMPYTYAIADTSVATIDENAKITFLAPGTTTGTLTTKSGIVFPFEVNVYEEESEGGSGSTPANDLVLYVVAPRSTINYGDDVCPFYIYSDVEGTLENHYDEPIPIILSFYDADNQLVDSIEAEQWLEGDSYQPVWADWEWWDNRIDREYSYVEFSFDEMEYQVIEPSTARVRVRSLEEQGKLNFQVDRYLGEQSVGQTVTIPLTCTTPELLAEYAAQGEVKVTAILPNHAGQEIIKDVVPAVFDADTLTASLSFTVGEDVLPGRGYDIVLYCGAQKIATVWIDISSGVSSLTHSMTMLTGESRALPLVLPDDVDLSKLYFEVRNPSVLSVNANGVATALAAGETEIYIYYEGPYGSVRHGYFFVRVYEPTTENPPVLTVTPLVDTVAFGDRLPVKLQLSGDTSELADSEITFVLEMAFLDENMNFLDSSGWWFGSMAENYIGEGMTDYVDVWTTSSNVNRIAYAVVTARYNSDDASFALAYDYSLISVTDVPDGNSTLYNVTVENEKIGQGDWAYFRIKRLPPWIGRDVTMSLCDAEGNELDNATYHDGNYSTGMSIYTIDFEAGQTHTLYLYVDGEPVDGVSVSFYVGEPTLSIYGLSSRMTVGNTCSLNYRFANNYDCPVTFSSSDESIACVEEENVLHLLGKGNVTITATCEHGQTVAVDVIVYDPDSAYVPEVYLSTDMAGTAEWMNSLRYKIGVPGDLAEIPYNYMEFNLAVQVLDADGNVLYDSADEGTYAYGQHYLQVNEQYVYWNDSNVWCKAAELDGRFIRLVMTTNTQSINDYTIDESSSSVTFELEPLEECTTPIVRVDRPSTVAKGEPIEVTFTCYNPGSLGSGMTVKLMQNWDEDNPLVQGLLTRANPSVTLSYTPDDDFAGGSFQYGYVSNAGSFYVNVFSYTSLGYDWKLAKGEYKYFYPSFSGSSVSLTYTSSDETVATVADYGNRVRVDAVGVGTSVITGTTPSGESRSFTVTVCDLSNTVMPELYLDQSQNGATLEWEQTFSLTVKSKTDPWMFGVPVPICAVKYLDADGNVLGSSVNSSYPEHSFVTQTDSTLWSVDLSQMAGYYAQGARSVRVTLEENGYTVDEANASVTLNIADPQQSETPIIYYTVPQYANAGNAFDVTFTCMNPQTLGEGVHCAVRGDGDEEATVLLLTQEQPSATGTMTVPEQYANYSGYYVYFCTNYDVEYPRFDCWHLTLLRGSINVSNPVLAIGTTTQASVYLYTQYDELSLTWESADTSIATVDENGVVTGVAAGVTQILAHYGPLTLTQAIRVYDSANAQTPEYYLVNANPDQTAGPGFYVTLYLGTTTALDKLGDSAHFRYEMAGVDAQGEVVKSFGTTSTWQNFIDSNEVSFSYYVDSDYVISAMYAGATQLRVRLIEDGDAYTIDPQRGEILIPISDPSTWEETRYYMSRPEVLYPGQEVTLDVDMVSCESSMMDKNFVCIVSVSTNGEYLLEPTEQIISASNPSIRYTFSVPENVDTSSASISFEIKDQDDGDTWLSNSYYVDFAYFTRTQSDTAIAKDSTFSAYYSGYGLSNLSKSFESSNPEVATVDEDGTVTGVSVGVATITTHYGELEHSFMVRVYDAETMASAKLSLSAPETLTEWLWTGKGELLLTADQPIENLGNLTRVTLYSYYYDADGSQIGSYQYQYIDVALIESNQVVLSVSNTSMTSMALAGAVSVKHELRSYSGNGFSIDNNAKSVVLPMQPLAESSEPLLYTNTSSSDNYVFSNNKYPLDIHAANTSYSSPVTVLAYANISNSRVEFDRVTFTPSECADVELNIAPPAGVSSFVVHAVRVNSDGTETALGSYNIQLLPSPVAVTTLAELQSEHPYANNFDYAWSYTVEGATSLSITFDSQSKTESTYYDPLRVCSSAGYESQNMEHTLGGTIGAQTVSVDGDTVIIWLRTDGSSKYYGFAVTKIEATMEDGTIVTITE